MICTWWFPLQFCISSDGSIISAENKNIETITEIVMVSTTNIITNHQLLTNKTITKWFPLCSL